MSCMAQASWRMEGSVAILHALLVVGVLPNTTDTQMMKKEKKAQGQDDPQME